MTLQALLTAEEHAKLPDHFKPEYKLNDKVGRYVLDTAPVDGWALEDVKGLKAMYSEKSEALKAAKTKLTEYEGLDPAAARAALERIETLGELGDKGKVEQRIETIKAQYEAKTKADLEKRDGDIKSLTAQIEKLLVDGEVARILSKPEVRGSFPLLIGSIKERVKVERDDRGGFVAKVYDPKTGAPMLSQKQGDSGLMGLEEFITGQLRPQSEYAPAFAGSGNTGSGAVGTGNNGHATTTTSTIDPKLPASERLRILRERGAARV